MTRLRIALEHCITILLIYPLFCCSDMRRAAEIFVCQNFSQQYRYAPYLKSKLRTFLPNLDFKAVKLIIGIFLGNINLNKLYYSLQWFEKLFEISNMPNHNHNGAWSLKLRPFIVNWKKLRITHFLRNIWVSKSCLRIFFYPIDCSKLLVRYIFSS